MGALCSRRDVITHSIDESHSGNLGPGSASAREAAVVVATTITTGLNWYLSKQNALEEFLWLGNRFRSLTLVEV